MRSTVFITFYLIFLNLILYLHYHRIKYYSLSTKYDYYYQNDMLIFPNSNINFLKFRDIKFEEIPKSNFINEISIISQMDKPRLPRLYSLLERWNSTIHVVFYVRLYDYEISDYNPETILNEIFDINLFKRVHLHLVIDKFISKNYPLNELRNIAWNYVATKFVFSIDIDFVPCENFDIYLLKNEKFIKERVENSLFIIPAFHYHCQYLSKIETCFLNHEYYEIGQKPTNYSKWNQTNIPYQINYELFYEPYFISLTNIPKYNQDFTIGHDKTSHLYELISLKYNLWVLPNLYIGHIPHSSHMPHSLLHNTYDPIHVWVEWEKMVKRIYKSTGFDLYCKTLNHTYIPFQFRENTNRACKSSLFNIY